MQLVEIDAAIDKALVRVKTEGKAYQNLVHRVAVSILVRGFETRDFRKPAKQFGELVANMPGATRTNALIAWVENYAPLLWNSEEKSFQYTSIKGFEPAVDAAKREPFWEFVPEPQYQPITDFNKLIEGLVKRAEKDLTEMKDKSKVDPAKVEKIKALLA